MSSCFGFSGFALFIMVRYKMRAPQPFIQSILVLLSEIVALQQELALAVTADKYLQVLADLLTNGNYSSCQMGLSQKIKSLIKNVLFLFIL